MAAPETKVTDTSPPLSSSNNICRKGESKHHNQHAHFQVEPDKDVLEAHDSKILIEDMGDSKLNVRLGFLQIKHVYEIRFSVEDDLGEDVTVEALDSVHAKITSANPSEDGRGHDIVLTFNAVKEKIMQETVTISSKEPEPRTLTLVLHARVLGKGKGTPSLKQGIHCVKIEWDEESDASDWQGF